MSACPTRTPASSTASYSRPTIRSPPAERMTCGSMDRPSGLWHQVQASGQPFMKTVVRMPGPSCTVNSRMSKTTPRLIGSNRGSVARSSAGPGRTTGPGDVGVAHVRVGQHRGQERLLRGILARHLR